jgi:hypothetical protein
VLGSLGISWLIWAFATAKEQHMSLEKHPRGSPDDQHINVEDIDELHHWARLLGTTPEQIKEAVARVGKSPARVREYLEAATGAL